jgi:hypothetical protein
MLNLILSRARAMVSFRSPPARTPRTAEPQFWILFAR